jgi:hypothetical protein
LSLLLRRITVAHTDLRVSAIPWGTHKLAPRRWWITTHFVVDENIADDHPTALADVTADGASKDGPALGHVPLVTPASQRLLA